MNYKVRTLITAILIQGTLFAQFKPADFNNHAYNISEFNDDFQNINPVASDDGDELWFTKIAHPSNLGKKEDQDIWHAKRVDGDWGKPTNDLAGLNSIENDLIIGLSQGPLLYTLQYRQGEDKDLHVINAFRRAGTKYQLDHQIEIPDFQLLSEFFGFYVSPDETYIILSMKGEYSFGKEDLYVIRKENGFWTAPIHLGARINTIGFEMSPHMSRDGEHLFFASEGHGSYGSADIFVSHRLDESWQSWSKPVNLGPNINTPGFEAYFSLNDAHSEAYFVSNREGKSGMIYGISYRQSNEAAQVSAHPAASGFLRLEKLPSMNVKLNLLDEHDQVIQSVTTNQDGYFNLQSFLPDRDYKLVIDDSVRSDLGKADIFLTNDLGDKMVYMNQRELGIFGFKVLSGQKVEEVERFEALASGGKIVDKPTTISGKVATFGTLNSKVTLKVVDENNKTVETVETDSEGYFSFNTSAQEKSYFLSVDQDLKGLVDVYEIFLTNDNPNEDIIVTKTDKHLFEFRSLSDGSEERLRLLAEHDKSMPRSVFEKYGMEPTDGNGEITGYLKLGKLPMINAEIMLMDENDKVLHKVMTDDEGMFVFNDALGAGNYSLQLDENQEGKLNESEIFLARNPHEVLIYLNDKRSGVFAFKKLAGTKPMTLYSLRTETERGAVVNENEAGLKGKFEYKKLPKSGVKLKLMDERENVIQVTEVNKNGEFEFEHFMVNESYFISVEEGEGLSDIYEIYLSGEHKNVLVNRTNKFVFSFKVLPSQDIILSQSYETDASKLNAKSTSSAGTLANGTSSKSAYYEFDLNVLEESDYVSLKRIKKDTDAGYDVVLRISREASGSHGVELETIDLSDVKALEQKLVVWGIHESAIQSQNNGSDQIIISISQN